jgi:ring-1,2-phenylacetyl-CoA epoxidase subunit PaaE
LERLIEENVTKEKEKYFYLCGPVSFMRMAQFTLKWMGYDDEHIKKENFTIDFIPPPPLLIDSSPKEITIHFNKQIFRINASYPVSILQAALDRNIQLPYSCRSGRCASCIAKCVHGKIKMSNNEVLTDNDLKKGLVLTCVGYAETDVELEW